MHGFVRGIGGAVVAFPEAADGARLWLAAEDEVGRGELDENHAHFPVMTCTTCGQHYYIAFLKDFIFTGKQPGGGEAGVGSHWWPSLEETNGGKRAVLFDRLIGASDDDGEVVPHARTASLHFCRQCGTAHPGAVSRCRSCGTAGATVQLHAIRQSSTSPTPGTLTSCLSCGSAGHRLGGRYREPTRSVRAITVSDVHVLTQDMVHHADPHAIPDESDWEWVELDTARSLRPGMFVAQVVGKSMEPRIPDGAYCLFASPVTGTRQGRTVLVQLRDAVDPDSGERFTVKRYRSDKAADEDGWRHVRVVLEPSNPEFRPIELKIEDEGSVAVVAELVDVIGAEPPF